MSIKKTSATRLRKREAPYTTLPNESIKLIKKTDAMAIWVHLQTKPEGWVVRSKEIQKHFGIGRDKYRKAMTYLASIGLVSYVSHQDEAGHLQGTDIVIHASPVEVELRETEKPTLGKWATEGLKFRPSVFPTVGKSGLLVMERPNSNGKTVINDQRDALNSAFQAFWDAGMVKVGKAKAREVFEKLAAADDRAPADFADILAQDVKTRLGAGVFGFDKLHPTTYLNQQRWLDDVPEHCPHAAIVAAWNELLPAHIEKISVDDWTPDSRGFQSLAAAWENFKTRPRASTGKPVFTEESEGVEFYREVFRRLAKVDRIQSEDAARWCRLSWAAQQQVTVQIFNF